MPGRTSKAPTQTVGFTPDAFAFLRELERHNERPWFEANRARYESLIRQPAFAFIAAFAPELKKIAPHFVADPRPVGGSLMRIHRDTRFSADKTPYKTNIGMHFRHSVGKDVHAPGLYVHLDNDRCFLGVGLWHPEPDALAKIRARIIAKRPAWKKASTDAAFRKVWKIEGESLVRPPKGFDPEDPSIEDLKRKDHIAACTITPKLVTSPSATKEIATRFAAAKPYLEFLCTALGLPL
jgi:uncharacterized protein (TIGR02453 family)